ncbi:hypothetical protein PENSPDRAFT_195743 [Peniophora sp. CONT]|nr:hypothetical protein PENSPDRAFT_195743 [Peniophora sp. CONT]
MHHAQILNPPRAYAVVYLDSAPVLVWSDQAHTAPASSLPRISARHSSSGENVPGVHCAVRITGSRVRHITKSASLFRFKSSCTSFSPTIHTYGVLLCTCLRVYQSGYFGLCAPQSSTYPRARAVEDVGCTCYSHFLNANPLPTCGICSIASSCCIWSTQLRCMTCCSAVRSSRMHQHVCRANCNVDELDRPTDHV